MQKSKGLAQHLLSVEALIRGVDGLREPRSHAVHHPRTIDPEIERRIIELGREHPDWGKKRKNRGTTADRPNKTINIDLCEKSPEKGEKMDAYVLMRNNKDKGDEPFFVNPYISTFISSCLFRHMVKPLQGRQMDAQSKNLRDKAPNEGKGDEGRISEDDPGCGWLQGLSHRAIK